MNKHFKQVLRVLRTKAKALGLNYKELKGVAAKIADNLELEDDASEEDVNSAIEDAVDDAMSFLSVSQSAAQRAIANYKAKHNISDDNPDDDDDSDDNDDDPDDDAEKKKKRKGKHQKKKSKSNDDTDDGDDDTPGWAKNLTDAIVSLRNKVLAMEDGKVSEVRRGKLEELLKDTGKFGVRKLKEFDRIASTFKDDSDFDQYLDEVSDDLDDYNQERADLCLSKLGQPGAGSTSKEDHDKPKELTDEQIEALVADL